MVQHLIRSDIKNCQSIYCLPSYHLFTGNCIQSCSKQGGALSKYPSVKLSLTAMAPLPDTKLLVQDGRSINHILDLEMGNVIVSKKMPRDVISTKRFAVSDDGRTAFRIWLRGRKHYLAVIDLQKLDYCVYPYNASLSSVIDLVCRSENELLVLETEVDADRTCHGQVTSVRIGMGECKTAPLYTWSGNTTARFFDGRYVWESGYKIRDLSSGDSFGLLENSNFALPEKHVALAHAYYPNENYLQIIDGKQNIFIDCRKREIIARYLTDPQKGGYRGILSEDEFWIGRPDGIYARPFPIIEDA